MIRHERDATGRGGDAAGRDTPAPVTVAARAGRIPPVPAWKRALDVSLALLIGVLVLPLALGIALLVRLRDGRPVLYQAERMAAPGVPFMLLKFRTMRPMAEDRGVTGPDKAARVTATGRVLRRYRLDEIPQLLNVLRGEMSFVGPRPPLREYVERFPDLYARVLACRPGITGLATLVYHRHEERLLSRARSAAETDRIYARACVPRKARLDLIYRRNRAPALDLWILWRTALAVLPGARGRPAARRRRKGRRAGRGKGAGRGLR